MIKAIENTGSPEILRVGDEPADLALGRVLAEARDVETILFPAKGETGLPTVLGGESAEWVVRGLRDRLAPGRAWLLDLAAGEIEADRTVSLSRSAIRDISVLLASARRSAAHDLAYAFEVLAGSADEVRRDPRLRAFREECARAVRPALAARPRFAWRVALVSFRSAEAVEDIVAARWRDRLSRYVVLAANHTYVAGSVSYAFRGPESLDAAGILLSALPEGCVPPRVEKGGTAGRGTIPAGGFRELLSRLKFQVAV